MEEDYVSFEDAKRLKDLGYQEEDLSMVYPIETVSWQNTYEGNPYKYETGDRINLIEEAACGSYRWNVKPGKIEEDSYIACPTLYQAWKWLMTKNVWIEVVPDCKDCEHNIFDAVFKYRIITGKDNKIEGNYGYSKSFDKPEDALGEAITIALEKYV